MIIIQIVMIPFYKQVQYFLPFNCNNLILFIVFYIQNALPISSLHHPSHSASQHSLLSHTLLYQTFSSSTSSSSKHFRIPLKIIRQPLYQHPFWHNSLSFLFNFSSLYISHTTVHPFSAVTLYIHTTHTTIGFLSSPHPPNTRLKPIIFSAQPNTKLFNRWHSSSMSLFSRSFTAFHLPSLLSWYGFTSSLLPTPSLTHFQRFIDVSNSLSSHNKLQNFPT